MPRKETTVTGIWDSIKFVCGNEIPDPDAEGKLKKCHSPFDSEFISNKPVLHCPVCGNTASYYDAEKAVQKISDEMVEAAQEEYEINFTNEKFRILNKKERTTTVFRCIKDAKHKITLEVYKEVD